MNQKRITYRIRQDGIVEEQVEGCNGDTCESITRDIENALGDLTRRIHTSEYYQAQKDVTNVSLQHNQD
tara:strand:+ start:220 stop:426 length:207 start_codon:yes stop_codon:yes gene_type:complete